MTDQLSGPDTTVESVWLASAPDLDSAARFGRASRSYRRLLHRALRHYDEQLGPRLSRVAEQQSASVRRTGEEVSQRVDTLAHDVADLAAELVSWTEGVGARHRSEVERRAREALHARIDEVQQAAASSAELTAHLWAGQQALATLPDALRALEQQVRETTDAHRRAIDELVLRLQALSDGARALGADVRELAGRQDAVRDTLRDALRDEVEAAVSRRLPGPVDGTRRPHVAGLDGPLPAAPDAG